MTRFLQTFVLALLAGFANAAFSAGLEIRYADATTHHWTDAQLRELPVLSHDGDDHGKAASWSGLDFRALLLKAGAPLDQPLRGPALRARVIVTGRDGYAVGFALSEFDATLGARNAVLADTRDGKPLSEAEGPWRLLVIGDQRAARSVRQIAKIELLMD